MDVAIRWAILYRPTAMSAALQSGAREAAVLDHIPAPTLAARHRMALRDLAEAASLWRLCGTLAWLDIKLRYRGSVLGPFWLTMSTAVMVAAMGGIYAALFKMNLRDYLPFLALSLVLWNFLGTLAGEACAGYTQSESMIRSVRMPYSLYAARIVLRNGLVLAHNAVVIVAVFALLRVWPGAAALLALPGLALWVVDAVALAILLGALCARFRDIPPIVGSIVQMAFFVTPVIWKPELVGADKQWMLPFNPCFSLLDVVRAPLLGNIPPAEIYFSAILYSLALLTVTWVLFVRVRGRIAFWV
jgi:lipopolysaccharide transport system permease protein